MASVAQLNEKVARESALLKAIADEIRQVIVGQEALVERLLIALVCHGHVLIEGVPGLAKTLTIRTLADALRLDFQRVQFTPDLLPADLIGTQIYSPATGAFTPYPGPIFTNLILADEINRAPAKVQSALLEAMEEGQVTLGGETRRLADPFMVLATQNPLEQEGTYPLPEAQLDRFLLKVMVSYPTRAQERDIMERMGTDTHPTVRQVASGEQIRHLRAIAETIYVDTKIKDYILDIIFTTRDPASTPLKQLKPLIDVGASPRATLALMKCARAYALLRGRGFVIPEDVKAIAPDVLRHRLILSFEAEADNITTAQVIDQLLARLPVP
ncbi:MAG TPA: MoxR family ATPase [Aggregatilineales bacterium]|nr:MoxR family ATPase [Aggregatilineales bacterium]